MANAAPAAREPEAIDVVSRLPNPCCPVFVWYHCDAAPRNDYPALEQRRALAGCSERHHVAWTTTRDTSPTLSFGADVARVPFRLLHSNDGGYAGAWSCLRTAAINTYRTRSTTSTWKMTTMTRIVCPFVTRKSDHPLCNWLQTLTERKCSTGGASLASNVTRYRYENGRRYHSYSEFTLGLTRLSVLTSQPGDGTYYAPNDEKYSNYETIV
jgi:hypothetical protein